MEKACKHKLVVTSVFIGIVLALFFVFFAGITNLALQDVRVFEPEYAYAGIKVGGEEIQNTWTPEEMISSDLEIASVAPEDAPSKLMRIISNLVMFLLPFVIIACVVQLMLAALHNLFKARKPEEKIRMGELIKNMIVNFFWLLTAPIVVELIVFFVTNGETLLLSQIFSA